MDKALETRLKEHKRAVRVGKTKHISKHLNLSSPIFPENLDHRITEPKGLSLLAKINRLASLTKDHTKVYSEATNI